MGAFIDVILASIARVFLRKVNKHVVKIKLKQALVKYGLFGILITDKLIDFTLIIVHRGRQLCWGCK